MIINKIWQFIVNFLKSYFVFFALLIVFIASSYALFFSNLFLVHDFTHATRIAEMARALDEGQFPVRWSANFGYGFGMPLFNFYAPLPYFIGAIFFKMGFSIVNSVKLLCLLINLLSLLGAYLLGKKMLGRFGGLLLSTAYILAPYRALNLYVRGAFSESFAMALLPFVLFAIISFVKKQDKKYLLLLILSLLGIILSHNLTALIFIPLAALFVLLYLWQQKKHQLIWIIAGQFFLALALSAFYMLPAFMEKDLTIINKIFSDYFHYSLHFLYIRQFFQENWKYGGSMWGPNDDISFFLGFGQLLALTVLVLMSIYKFLKNRRDFFRNSLFFYIFIFASFFGLSLFMSLMRSKFLWENLSILQYLQFPWRFLSLASFFLAILVALSIYLLPKTKIKFLYGAILFLILLSNLQYFHPEKYLDNADALYYTDAQKIQNYMSSILPDYIPLQMAEEKILLAKNQELPSFWLEDTSSTGIMTSIVDRGFEKMISTNFTKAEVLNFKVANFIGWQAELDGEKWSINTNQELGNIQLNIPAGQHRVGIYFSENTTARKIGDAVSVFALLISCYFFYPFAKDKNPKKKAQVSSKR